MIQYVKLKQLSIMVNYSLSYSVLLNRNFRLKIGRTLYGYSGALRLLGARRLHQLIDMALCSIDDVFVFWSRALGCKVSFYAK